MLSILYTLQWNKNITLYTDTIGERILGFLPIETVTGNMKSSPIFWMDSKFQSYKQQTSPFVYLDTDVILGKPLNLDTSYDLNIEYKNDYKFLNNYQSQIDWISKYIKDDPINYYYNCGIVNFNNLDLLNDYIKEYEKYKNIIETNYKEYRSVLGENKEPCLLAEQYVIAKVSKGKNVNCILDKSTPENFKIDSYKQNYIHLSGNRKYMDKNTKWIDSSLRSKYFNKNRKSRIGRMSFKSRRNRQSYRLPNQKFKLKGNKIRLERIGWVRVVVDREIPEDVKFMSVTISKTPTNQYYVSILVEQEIKYRNNTNEFVGIDVGLKEFLTTSDGDVVSNPRYFSESQRELGRLQKHLSRKKKGSRRREKLRLKVAKLHQKIRNQREWFLHNESTKLVFRYDIISVEDLNIKGMMANSRLSKSIGDVGWGIFYNMLEYKCRWYGKEFVRINRFEPTSKTCSECGWKDDNLGLSDRTFQCRGCGIEIDRDLNASKNIKRVGVTTFYNQSQRDSKPCRDMS